MREEALPRTVDRRPRIDLEGLDAYIMDMDGVVTNTARVHANAWKQTFDAYLREREEKHGERFVPFDKVSDYLQYVNGKPRCEGIRSFLESRRINLPYGSPRDPPQKETVCGLGNRKNQLFIQWLESCGAEPFPSTVSLIRSLRSRGTKLGLITASKNAKKVLKMAGLSDLFEVVVDGVEADRLGLRGKPAPDVFLEAARRLGVRPERAAVVEDALAGVEAGRAGGFAMVIGVDREGHADELRRHGADLVVQDLSELGVEVEETEEQRRPPSALERTEEIYRHLREGVPAILLDYEGVLAPSSGPPRVLSKHMRTIIQSLSRNCLVAVMGDDIEGVRERVGLDNLSYIGHQGFDAIGPGGARFEADELEPFLPWLDKAEEDLRGALRDVRGVRVERGRYELSVLLEGAGKDEARAQEAVDDAVRRFPQLRAVSREGGVLLHPVADWGKGRMATLLLDRSYVNGSQVVLLYIGSDLGGGAFSALKDRGMTILVGAQERVTDAGYVLKDVGEVHTFLRVLADRFEEEVAMGIWALTYNSFEPEQEKLRESLCTLGNGYMASRGAAPESTAGRIHYPGTYLAGVYNRLESRVDGHTVENESIVNIPNWLPLSFRIEGGEWFDLSLVEIKDFRQELDMRRGILSREVRFTDGQGRRTLLRQRRLVSMEHPHIASLETTLTPENWSGNIQVLSALDGRVENSLVSRYRPLNNRHLEQVGTGTEGQEVIWLQVETAQSHVRIAEAARTRVFSGHATVEPKRAIIAEHGYIGQELEVTMEENRPVRVEKVVAVYSSKDHAIADSLFEAVEELRWTGDFDELCSAHLSNWDKLWSRCRIDVDTDHEWMSQILNLHILHLLQTVSFHSIDLDVGVPPRGLHGEAYRGLIMWDEVFIFPFLNLRIPDMTRALMLYRYRRLPWARRAARRSGHAGAMYPWQSGSDGREEAQKLHLNPMSGRWIPDHSHLQRHISLAIAYNIWQYYQVTGDLDFMALYGAEILIEIARFWANKVQYNEDLGRYEILGVMGPDEFHEGYPGAEAPGINNNAYTNVMVAWALCRTLDTLRLLPLEHHRNVWEDLSLGDEELERWEDISRRMYVPFHDGVISQFDGYDDLEELDLTAYGSKYCDIHRLDRILKAEGDSPDRYKISKQADVLMLFYLLSEEELQEMFSRLSYSLDEDMVSRTIDYYAKRTSHGSTLSRVVHAWVLSRRNREVSWNMFLEAMRSDIADIQCGTTREGIHLGAMASTVDIVQRCYAGVETRGDALRFDPYLPPGLTGIRFDIEYRHHRLEVDINEERLRLTSWTSGVPPIRIGFRGEMRELGAQGAVRFDLR